MKPELNRHRAYVHNCDWLCSDGIVRFVVTPTELRREISYNIRRLSRTGRKMADMNERKGKLFSVAAENTPVAGCTVSKAVADVDGRRISHFAIAAGTAISHETYGYHKLWIGASANIPHQATRSSSRSTAKALSATKAKNTSSSRARTSRSPRTARTGSAPTSRSRWLCC